MNFRKWLLTTAVFSGLAGIPSGFNQGQAAQLLSPQSGWAISDISTPQGDTYCALARKFDENIVLTFAQNMASEGSIAIDFQKTILNSTQSYDISLDPGMGQKKSYRVKPVSNKAMVIRIGDDSEFYQALGQSRNMAVTIGSGTDAKSYYFDVSDIQTGQGKLTTCLATLDQNEPGSKNIKEAEIAATPDKTVLTPAPQEQADLSGKDDLHSLRMENMRLRNALARERRQYESEFMAESSESNVVNDLRERMELLSSENRSLHAQLNSQGSVEQSCALDEGTAENEELAFLKQENSRLRAQIGEMNQRLALAEEAGAGQDKILSQSLAQAEDRARAAEAELVELSRRAVSLESKLTEADQTIAQLQAETAQSRERAEKAFMALAEANKKLESQTRQAGDVSVHGLSKKVALLEAENRSLRTKLAAREGTTQVAGADAFTEGAPVSYVRSLEAELASVKRQRDAYAKQVENLQQNSESALVNVAADNWDLEKATRRFNEAEREIRRLGIQIEKERATCNNEKRKIEAMLFDPRIASREQIEQVRELEREVLAKEAALVAQESEYKDKIASLKQSLDIKEGELLALQNENKSQRFASMNAPSFANRAQQAQTVQPTHNLAEDAYSGISPAAGKMPVDIVAEDTVRPPSVSYLPEPVEAKALNPQYAAAHPQAGMPPSLPAVSSNAAITDRGAKFLSGERLTTILQTAGIAPVNVTKANAENFGATVAYTWETGELYGSAEQKPITNSRDFDRFAEAYLTRVEERCDGEFAVVPVIVEQRRSGQLSGYEIACMNTPTSGAAVSVLFTEENGVFTTFSHEGSLEAMAKVMDSRDRLSRLFEETVLASR